MADRQIRFGIGFNVDKTGLQEIRAELKNIQSMSLGDLKLIDKNATRQTLKDLKEDAALFGEALEKSFNPKLGTTNIATFNSILNRSTRSIKEMEANFAKAGAQGTISFRNMTANLFTTQKAVKQTSNLIDSMAKTLFNTIKWSVASGAINTVTGAIQKAWGHTKSLDASLNDIRIVTEKSAEDMDKFAVKANKAAKALGAATTAYTKASLIYYQQGLDEEDVQARTDVTIKAANVTGQSAAEVSEQLTAVWNGYKVVADEAESYVDKLSAVAATTASDLEELSEGMAKVASGANAMGVDIDQLTAQLSTIISVTRQDASSVGTALKTIFARMGDLKVDGVDEFGVSLGDVSGTLKQVGIDVLDQQGNLRDMGVVMEEVAGKWGTWTEAQQQAIAVAMAGKRQYNNLLALFENWDMYESALTTSQTSEGTLQKQQDIYMDSLEAKLQQIGTSAERVYKSLFDSESMKDFLDVLSVVIDGIGSFIDGIGGGGNLLLGIFSILGSKLKNDIAIGLGKAAYNSAAVKENALQARAEMELQAKYTNVSDQAMQKMLALYKEKLKAEKFLTEEEKAQYDLLIKQTAENQNQIDQEKQKQSDLEKYYQQETGSKLSLSAKKSSEKRQAPGAAASVLEERAKINEGQVGFVQEAFQKNRKDDISLINTRMTRTREANPVLLGMDRDQLQERAHGIKLELNTERDSGRREELQNEKEAIELLIKERVKLNKIISETIDISKVSKKQQDVIAQAQEDFAKGLITEKALQEKLQKALKNSEKEYRTQAEEIKKGTKAYDDLLEKQRLLEAQSKAVSKATQFKTIVANTTELVTGFGKAVAGMNSFINVIKVFNNEDLNGWEKFSQIVSGLLISVPMIISGFKGIGSAILGIVTATNLQNTSFGKAIVSMAAMSALNKASTEEDKKAALTKLLLANCTDLTAEELKEKSAADLLSMATERGLIKVNEKGALSFLKLAGSIWATIWPIGLIMAAIAALILTIVWLVNLFKNVEDNGQAAFKAASEAAKSATEAFNETKQAYDDLKKSLEDYNNAQKAIEELTKGTEEWQKAIQEANMQVIDLLDKYPELAQYISEVDGQLKISEAGHEAVLEAQENKVNEAARMKMATNISKAKAENNMLRQQGANNALKTDSYQGWAIGAGIITGAASVGLGVLAGTLLNNEADRRQNAYDAALNVIADNGNSVLGNYETFAQKMSEAGVNNDLIQALWENKTELAKNSMEIAANNAAIKAQQQQIAASYLNDNSNTYQDSRAQSQISKIIGAKSTSDSQVYKDELARWNSGSGGVDKDKGVSLANNYFAKNNIQASGISYDSESGMVTYTDQNGDEKKMSAMAMAESLAQEKALAAAGTEGNVKAIENALNKVAKNFGQNLGKESRKAVTNFVAGEKADLTSLTEEELKAFSDTIGETDFGAMEKDAANKFAQQLGFKDVQDLEYTAKTLGYESADAYIDAMQTSVDNYEYEADRILVGLDDSVKNAFNKLNTKDFTKNWSLATKKAVANSLENAFQTAGPYAVAALKDIYSQMENVSNEDLQGLANAAKDIDWTSSSAVMEFKNQVRELGINISEVDLDTFADKMSSLANVVSEVANNLNRLSAKLKEIKDLTKDLKLGNVLSEEDYKKLIAHNEALEDYFVKTVDGYKYLGGADTEVAATMNNILDPEKTKKQFDIAEEEGKKLLGENFDLEDEDTEKEIDALIKRGNVDNFIASSGYTAAQLKDALGRKDQSSSYKAASGYSLGELAEMSAKDLVEKTKDKDGKATITEAEAQNIIDDAKGQVDKADDMINSAYGNLITNLNAIETEDFKDISDEAIGVAVSAQANTYEELKQWKDLFGEEENYKKLAKVYLAEESAQLGVSAKAWEKIAESMPLDDQEKYLDNIKKIQMYNEVDYYKKYTDQINKLNTQLERLEQVQETLTGKALINNLKEQTKVQTELVALEEKKFAEQQKEWQLRRDSLKEINNPMLESVGIINGITYNAEGKVDEATRAAIFAAAKNAEGEDRQAFIDLLNEIDEFNNKIIEGTERHAEVIREAYQTQIDLLLKSFDTAIQVHLDFNDAKVEWEKFKKSLYIGEGLSFFDEKTSSDMFEVNEETGEKYYNRTIFDVIEDNLNTVYKGINDLQSQYDKAQLIASGVDLKDAEILSAKTAARMQEENVVKSIQAREEKEGQYNDAKTAADSAYKTLLEKEKKKTELATKNTNALSDLEAIVAQRKATATNFRNVSYFTEQAEAAASKKGVSKELLQTNFSSDFEAYTALREAKLTSLGLNSFLELHDMYKKAQENEKTYDNMLNSITEAENAVAQEKERQKDYLVAEQEYNNALADYNQKQKTLEFADSRLEAAKSAELHAKTLSQAAQDFVAKKEAEKEAAKAELQEFSLGFENFLFTADGNVNTSLYEEKMGEMLEQAQGYYKELQETVSQVYESWSMAQEEIISATDEQISKLSSMNGILQSQADLMKLVGKNSIATSSTIQSLYGKMSNNAEKSYDTALKQLTAAQGEYNKILELGDQASKEQIATVYENLQTASENVLSAASEYTTALATQYGESLTSIVDEYFKTITSEDGALGKDLKSITQDWELTVKTDERYLDEVNANYAMGELERKFQKSIDETDSYSAQKKLNSALQEQLKMLREKDKLSQYDIDRANAMYELTLKQIALEEAQNTANKMKLTRDASGNYSYQYVSDADAIAEAEEELAAAQNELYNMDKERNKELVDEYYAIWQEFQEKSSEAFAEGDMERVAQLEQYYLGPNGLLAGVQSELGSAEENLLNIGKILGGEDWISPFENFTEAIVKSDLGELTTKIQEFSTKSMEGFADATDALEKILTDSEKSPLLTATASLESSISQGIKELDGKLEASAENSMTAINALLGTDGKDGLLSQMATLGASLTSLGDAYQDYLEKNLTNDAILDNTTATKELTAAMLSYLDSLEEDDAKNDGKYGDYTKQDDGSWLVINAGDGSNN